VAFETCRPGSASRRFTLIIPAFVQVPLGRDREDGRPPLGLQRSGVAPLAKLVAGLMVRIRPLTCEEMSPLLVSAMGRGCRRSPPLPMLTFAAQAGQRLDHAGSCRP